MLCSKSCLGLVQNCFYSKMFNWIFEIDKKYKKGLFFLPKSANLSILSWKARVIKGTNISVTLEKNLLRAGQILGIFLANFTFLLHFLNYISIFLFLFFLFFFDKPLYNHSDFSPTAASVFSIFMLSMIIFG